MSLLGINLNILIGPSVPLPAPTLLMENLDKVEISQRDEGRSGFQITFKVGRTTRALLASSRLIDSPLLAPDNRIIITVIVNALPRVLMDGIIRHKQFNPGNEAGNSTLTITGEDIAAELDKEKITTEHPVQNEAIIAVKLIAKYARFGLVPLVIPPYMIDFPGLTERTPVQRDTDLGYLQTMAKRFGYEFYIRPGPVPGTNTAYWGPEFRSGLPARALSVNMGSYTNVESIDFQYDSEQATVVSGRVKDRTLATDLPFRTFTTTRIPPLARSTPLSSSKVNKTQLDDVEGLTYVQANARAQAMTNKSTDNVLTVTGEVDTERYGDVLQARGLAGLRGATTDYDGLYYIKQVTHVISQGAYRQRFTLSREGLGTTTPVVRP